MSYNHLTIEERSCIEYNLTQGVSGSDIAKLLKRDRATISREIRRNKSNGGYLPVAAQKQY